jgi:hypothetical protein
VMEANDLERLAERVDKLVEDLKAARADGRNLLSDKKKLEDKVAGLEKQLRQCQKEGDRLGEHLAQNKAYKRKSVLLRSKVVSMLAIVESMQ